jgi:hypothetical protein
VVVETKAGFVVKVYISLIDVVKGPVASLSSKQTAVLVFRRSPETQNTALVTVPVPFRSIDFTILSQWRDEFIAMRRTSAWKLAVARKLKPYSS